MRWHCSLPLRTLPVARKQEQKGPGTEMFFGAGAIGARPSGQAIRPCRRTV